MGRIKEHPRKTIIHFRVNAAEESLIATAFEMAMREHRRVDFATFIREHLLAGLVIYSTPAAPSPPIRCHSLSRDDLKEVGV